MTTNWHLAQMNIAIAKHPLDDIAMIGFVAQLDYINGLAEASVGFVWRLKTESGNVSDILVVKDDPRSIINMSVWESIDSLFDFTYKSVHKHVMAGRRQWFVRSDVAYQVMWWVPQGHKPSVDEGLERLGILDKEGPGARAFTFKDSYPKPE